MFELNRCIDHLYHYSIRTLPGDLKRLREDLSLDCTVPESDSKPPVRRSSRLIQNLFKLKKSRANLESQNPQTEVKCRRGSKKSTLDECKENFEPPRPPARKSGEKVSREVEIKCIDDVTGKTNVEQVMLRKVTTPAAVKCAEVENDPLEQSFANRRNLWERRSLSRSFKYQPKFQK